MSRPLSDAPTTFMPELYPPTMPLRVIMNCGWCGIRLGAIPDPPAEWDGGFYHPGGCVAAARGKSRGEETDLSRMIGKAGEAPQGGPTPRCEPGLVG